MLALAVRSHVRESMLLFFVGSATMRSETPGFLERLRAVAALFCV